MAREREEVLHALSKLGEDVYFARINWMWGTSKHRQTFRHEVREPPTNGWGLALLIDRDKDDRGKPVKLVTLFTLCWFDSFQVSRMSLEYQSLEHPEALAIGTSRVLEAEVDDRLRAYVAEALPRLWDEIQRHGWVQKDFDTAAYVMRRLGLPVPLIERAGSEERVSGGKEVSEGLIKPVKAPSRKGQVLRFFMGETKSIREAMAEFGISRSNVLSQLYLLQKDHGIGYELKNDAAIITLPKGCASPFEEAAA
jgi:hypothetical protein